MQAVIISSLVIMFASLIGVLFAWKGLSGFLKKNKKYLTTFAIGVFIVVTYSLIKETLHLTESPLLAIVSVLGGVLLIHLVSLLLPHHHHDTKDCCPEEHTPLNARRILFGDAIHNIGDGILLVSAFLISTQVGLIAALGILLHELVQEIAEFFILKEAGYTTRKALVYNFIVSSTIFIGVIIGLFASSIPIINIMFIGLAAGGFLYILAADLIPHTIRSIKNSGNLNAHIAIGILGMLTMLSTQLIVPHSHEHELDDHHENEITDDKLHNEHDEYPESHDEEDPGQEDHSSHVHQ